MNILLIALSVLGALALGVFALYLWIKDAPTKPPLQHRSRLIP